MIEFRCTENGFHYYDPILRAYIDVPNTLLFLLGYARVFGDTKVSDKLFIPNSILDESGNVVYLTNQDFLLSAREYLSNINKVECLDTGDLFELYGLTFVLEQIGFFNFYESSTIYNSHLNRVPHIPLFTKRSQDYKRIYDILTQKNYWNTEDVWSNEEDLEEYYEKPSAGNFSASEIFYSVYNTEYKGNRAEYLDLYKSFGSYNYINKILYPTEDKPVEEYADYCSWFIWDSLSLTTLYQFSLGVLYGMSQLGWGLIPFQKRPQNYTPYFKYIRLVDEAFFWFQNTPFDQTGENELFSINPEIFRIDTYPPIFTISFINITYPQFDVSLPDVIEVVDGDSITLPLVEGIYEDDDYIYTPKSWDIGEFGESITPDSNMTSNLVWLVEPKSLLPKVITVEGFVGTESSQGVIASFENNNSCYVWVYNSLTSSYDIFSYDNTTHVPCCARISDISGINPEYSGFLAEFNQSGNIKITNKTGSTYINAYYALCNICSSQEAIVINVYNSSNISYNAFKYSLEGTDYYYVLDGTQADWTDDLASIGYSLTPIEETLELFLGMRSSGSGANNWESVKYSAGTGYWAGILNAKDRYEAEEFGLQVHTNKWAGNIGGLVIDYTFDTELLAVYSDIDGNTPVEKGNNWIFREGVVSGLDLIYLIISNTVGFSTFVMSYKARFTKHDSVELTVYFTKEGGGISNWGVAQAKSVYLLSLDMLFDSGKTYEVIGVYNGEALLSGPFQITTSNNTTSPHFTRIQILNYSSGTISNATHAIIRVTNRQTDEREAWFNADKTQNYSWQSGGSRSLYNVFSKTFVENKERRIEIVRLEKANGDVVTVQDGSVSVGTSYTFSLKLASSQSSISVAKVVYRSLSTTKRAWINTSHTGQNLNAYTVYPLYDDAGNRPPELSVTSDALLGLYDENGNAISFSSSQETVTNSGGYLGLYIGNQAKPNVAFIIYKDT